MSFGTITEQLDLSTLHVLNSIDGGDPDDVYAGGLRLKLRDESGEMVNAVAYLGIIDILQNFRLAKRMEHRFKKLMYDGDACSVHNPNFYRKRFSKFLCGSGNECVFRPAMNSKTEPPEMVQEPTTHTPLMSGIQNPHFSGRSLHSRHGSNASASGRRKVEQKPSSLRQASSPTCSDRSSDSDELPELPVDGESVGVASSAEQTVPLASATPDLADINVSSISNWSEPMSPPDCAESALDQLAPKDDLMTDKNLGNLHGCSVTDSASELPLIRGAVQSKQERYTDDPGEVVDDADAASRLKSEIAAARAARKSKLHGSTSTKADDVKVISNGTGADTELDEFRLLEKQSSSGDTDLTLPSSASTSPISSPATLSLSSASALSAQPTTSSPNSRPPRRLPKTPTKMTML